MGRILGSVAEVAARWELTPRLANLAILGDAYDACLQSRVETSTRARTQAGAAYPTERRIILNALLLHDGREADRDATLLHECAHIVADTRHGRSCGHNERWRRVMFMMGEPPAACHNIDYLSREAHAVAVWICANCGQKQHFVRPPRRRPSMYYCIACGPEFGRLRAAAARPGTAPRRRNR